jgi:hypothetical protein
MCATALFSMWDVAIMPHISPRQVGRVVELSLMVLPALAGGRPALVWHTLYNIRKGPDLW